MNCKSSSIEAKTKMDEYGHSGTITHKCKLEESHDGMCECNCGAKWVKNYK